MEGEQGFLSPARPSRVSSEGGDGRGFGSPTWSSPLGPLLDSPSSCISEVGGCGNGGSGFSSPTWGSPLETLFNSPSSCVSDSRGGGNGSVSGFRTLKQTSPLEKLLDSPSSCVSDSQGDGNGSGFSTPKQASPLETLLNSSSPSSCVSDSRGRGNSSSPRVSKEQDSEVREAEKILRAIIERYNDCFLRLRNTTAEVADLCRERIRLGAENLHLSLLLEELEAAEQSKASAAALAPPLKPVVEAQAASGCAPRSIAIRSKDFLSQKQPQREAQPQRLRVRASPVMEDAGEKEKDDGEVEMEAYRQGAMKTELCNKWERGACSYEERCRFAHGMGELRPVIRHPRYKTLACQLFAAASGCPYGHRCHFRHSLPPTAQSC